jgi:hypothetical protein
MTDHARRLLSYLSILPEGLLRAQLDDLLHQQGDSAASTLRKVGLVYYEGDRLMMSAPLRDCVAAQYPPSSDDIQRIEAMRNPNGC